MSGGRHKKIVVGCKYLVMTDDFSSRGAAVHHECMTEPGTSQIRGMAGKRTERDELIATVTNDDESLALTIPGKVLSEV
jgi:hypothetical protein